MSSSVADTLLPDRATIASLPPELVQLILAYLYPSHTRSFRLVPYLRSILFSLILANR